MFETTKKLLADDAIGKLMYLECDYWHWIGPHYGQYTWSRTKEAGGSSLLSAGCHAVDALRWFGGDIVEVFGYTAPHFEGSDYEFEPNMVALLRFANGATGKVSSLLECTTPYIFNVKLFGEKGTIRNNKVYPPRSIPDSSTTSSIRPSCPTAATSHTIRSRHRSITSSIASSRECPRTPTSTMRPRPWKCALPSISPWRPASPYVYRCRKKRPVVLGE